MIWRREASRTHRIGAHTLTPVAQSIGIKWRGGGWLWQFPLAVEVEDEQGGASTRLPVPDPTRTVVWLLTALTVVVVCAMTMAAWRSRRHKRENAGQNKRQDKKGLG
jgi:hypothetical protein